jgi:glycosyltransferase involved in cell wall biosynthesis
MNQDIKFSVTVPAYKAQFLAECIDSILAQTYKNFELIIVNDASPQDLDSIVSKYNDPRIRYYKNEVGFGAEHVVGNWNKCLEYATGDYISCMGDDDKLLPNCLEEYVNLIEKIPGLDLYHSMTLMINENSKVIGIQEPRPLWESAYSMIYWRFRGRQQYIGDWLFKREKLQRMGGFYYLPYAWGSDDLSAIIAAKESGVSNTNKPGFLYRINSQTITNNTSNVNRKLECCKKVFQFYKDFLSKNPVDELDKIYVGFLKRSLSKEYSKALAWDLAADIAAHPVHILKWVTKYNYKTIVRAIYYSRHK